MASPTTKESLRTSTLAQSLKTTGTETSIAMDVTENYEWGDVPGMAKTNTGDNVEFINFTGVTTGATANGVTRQTLTGCTRGINYAASSLTDATAGNKKDHAIGTTVAMVLHSAQINKLVQNDADNTLSGDNTYSGTNTFQSTSKASLIVQSVTTAQRNALTGVANGLIVYDSDLGDYYNYNGGSWYAFSAGSTQPNASTTVAGKVEEATAAEALAKTAAGGTGARLFINPSNTNRLLDPSHSNATDILTLGALSTGNREVSLLFDVDDTNAFGYKIVRAAGVNGITTMTHDGTGEVVMTNSDNAGFNFNTTGRTKFSIPNIHSATAGETLAADDFVYFSQTNQKLLKADYTTTEKANIAGVIVTGGALDATVYYQPLVDGLIISGLSGLTAGNRYYASVTPGALGTLPDFDNTSVIPMHIGKAISTTQIVCEKYRIPRRTSSQFQQAANSATTATLTVGFDISHIEFHYTSAGYNGGNIEGLTGHGWYDDESTGGVTQRSFCSYYESASPAGGLVADASNAIILKDVRDSAGQRAGTASKSGNNLEIAWTDTTWATTQPTVEVQWIAYEAI